MTESTSPPPGGDSPEIADAEWLVRNERPDRSPSAKPEPLSEDPPRAGDYDLAPPAEGVPRPSTAFLSVDDDTTRAPGEQRARAKPALEPSAAVEQVWSRWAEWGPTLIILTASGLGVALLIYFLLSLELFEAAVLCLLAGGVALAVLSYPILITLERPVRVTPEQAVTDFYGALSHHVPHYRRMWLLLSTAGRTSGSFASFEGFTNYWERRLAELRGDKVGRFTPLKFQVADFKSDKSAGLSVVDATFRIEVSIRGRLDEGPVASIPVETSLVRGTDRMWYLDQGALPASRNRPS